MPCVLLSILIELVASQEVRRRWERRGGAGLHRAVGDGLGNPAGDAPLGRRVWTGSYELLRQSPAELADGVDAPDDIPTYVGLVGLADVGERIRVAEDIDRLFQLSKVLRADEDGSRMTVARDVDALVLAFRAVDQPGQVVANGAKRLVDTPQLWRAPPAVAPTTRKRSAPAATAPARARLAQRRRADCRRHPR